jgi:hypothetical protein
LIMFRLIASFCAKSVWLDGYPRPLIWLGRCQT